MHMDRPVHVFHYCRLYPLTQYHIQYKNGNVHNYKNVDI